MANYLWIKQAVAITTAFLWFAAPPAQAHLTWIEEGTTTLGLATGHHYPNKELSVSGMHVETFLCTTDQNPDSNTTTTPTALTLLPNSLRFKPPFVPNNCEAKLKNSTIVLNQDDAYKHLRESRASQTVFEQFDKLGQWQEQFFKSAQLAPIAINSTLYQKDRAQFITLDNNKSKQNVITSLARPPKIYLYKNHVPIPKQAVGLDSPSLPRTLWLETQADGEVLVPLILTEKAMLHAVMIEPSGEGFVTQFLTTLITPNQ